MKLNQNIITDLLYSSFKRDHIAVSQCKTGASYGKGLQIIDFWTMRKSWTNPIMTGYEIKTSRQDFLNDKKWMNYLNYCNEFYFITPIHLVDKKEIPEQAGLKYVSSTGTRIYTKKKAPYREIEFPVELFTYILMWRAFISKDEYHKNTFNINYWTKWLRDKNAGKELGYRVSHKIRKIINDKIERVEKDNKILKEENESADVIKKILAKMGFEDPDEFLRSWSFEDKFKERLNELDKGINETFLQYITNTINKLNEVKEFMENKK